MTYLGLDIGSTTVNAVVMDEDGNVLERCNQRTMGQPIATVLAVLQEHLRTPLSAIDCVGTTGTAGRLVASLLGGEYFNDIVAQKEGVGHAYPEVRTIVDMGGVSSKYLLVDYDESIEQLVMKDSATNSNCAAGTGSFLDQQASRFGVSIDEFSLLALKSEHPPRVAGRCSVFAKTDMIHLQQKGTPDYDIIAGLCFALARNFIGNTAMGKPFVRPVVLTGGVAANLGVVRAFRELLEAKDGEFIIPENFETTGAVGAALLCRRSGTEKRFSGLEELQSYARTHKESSVELEPLQRPGGQVSFGSEGARRLEKLSPGERLDVYIGIDVGSTSTKAVLIDDDKNVVAKCYMLTAGRPLDAVKKVMANLSETVGEKINIVGAATTGSGRYLIGDFVGADVVKNEITAQATASIALDPTVDTIFELGGQDSKYISIDNGTVVLSKMNQACAAGTGSFLEEQAEQLDISIRGQFGEMALGAKHPINLGERCTVFMESALFTELQSGADRENLTAGLAYSTVTNYLNRVVAGGRVGNRIFFQGAVAANQAVVAAFEKVTGKKIVVPEHHEVTGSIGAAIVAMEDRQEKGWTASKFKGFQTIINSEYVLRSFNCTDCANLCEVNEVKVEGESPVYYGSRCSKYDVQSGRKPTRNKVPNLFSERERYLMEAYTTFKNNKENVPTRGTVGVPRMLLYHELFPFWAAYLQHMGFDLVLSDRTNKELIQAGLAKVASETCFPIKVAHGHVMNLLGKKVEYMFMPRVIKLKKREGMEHSYTCPYVQSVTDTIRSAIDPEAQGVKLIQPVLYMDRGRKPVDKALLAAAREIGVDDKTAKGALDAAHAALDEFAAKLQKRGAEVLSAMSPDERAVVIVSRSYNGLDHGVNLDLPRKLREMGVLPIPMDFLPLDSVDLSGDWGHMYWRYGQKILSAGRIISQDKRLNALYLTNFGCGPDSFITRFFKRAMGEKPFLQIEVDEHSADAGVVTRVEAFLDSMKNVKITNPQSLGAPAMVARPTANGKRKIFLPNMADHAFALAAAFQASGVECDVLPESDARTTEYGRKYTSGKECYPCIVTTGDMIRKLKDTEFDPTTSAFLIPTSGGPCRLGQYSSLQRIIFEELGYDVPIISPSSNNSYSDLGVGSGFERKAWRGIVAVDLLQKAVHETRPYEKPSGQSNKIYQKYLKLVCDDVREGRDLVPTMKAARKEFEAVTIVRKERRAFIGMVGEIFVRSNRFSNENIISRIEELGGEICLAPMSEWFLYVNVRGKQDAWAAKDYGKLAKITIKHQVMKRDEHALAKPFEGFLEHLHERPTEEMLENAKPYLHAAFGGEAILSIGKSIDYMRQGAAGIVNVLPFTCLPGNVVQGVSRKVRLEYSNIPWLNMSFDGSEQTTAQTRLEAFMHQAREFKRSREAKHLTFAAR